VLRPGEIELTLRNDGPDLVRVAQVAVNDAYAPFVAEGGKGIGRLGSTTLDVSYPWIEGEAYEISVLTSTGATIETDIPVAAETPEADAGFFGLMALLGLYVGVIPVSLGMLWLPFLRRLRSEWVGALIAFTLGLLAFLAIDAALEGLDIAAEAPTAFGGASLVFLGALVAYLLLAGVDSYLAGRGEGSAGSLAGGGGAYLALLIAIGIGLHNLGEGLAIGSAYATGALALGAFLVVGFAIHNTTEGLAVVAPLRGAGTDGQASPGFSRLLALGLIAGGPAILGAWIGAAAFNPSLAALLFGVGVGAIARVIVQIAPAMRDGDGRLLHPVAVAGMLAGIAVLYFTGLAVSV
jgi:zinc transporter ZupT